MRITYTLFFSFCFLYGSAQTVTFDTFDLPIDTFRNGFHTDNMPFETELADFPTTWNTDFPDFPYWSAGWAISTMTDGTTSGAGNLYSAKPGAGFEGSMTYAIGQQNSRIENIVLPDLQQCVSFYVTNTTYAHNSIRDGDMFAKKFGGDDGTDPDFFLLRTRLVNEEGIVMDSADVYLADYRFEDSSEDYILDEWVEVELANPFSLTDELQFELFSTDTAGGFGINTPLFFAFDQFSSFACTIDTQDPDLAEAYRIFPNPVADRLYIEPAEPATGSVQIELTTITGRTVYETQLRNGQTGISTAGLAAGTYLLTIRTENRYFTERILILP